MMFSNKEAIIINFITIVVCSICLMVCYNIISVIGIIIALFSSFIMYVEFIKRGGNFRKTYTYVKKITQHICLELNATVNINEGLSFNPIYIDIRWKGDHRSFFLQSSLLWFHFDFNVYDTRHEEDD